MFKTQNGEMKKFTISYNFDTQSADLGQNIHCISLECSLSFWTICFNALLEKGGTTLVLACSKLHVTFFIQDFKNLLRTVNLNCLNFQKT